MNKRSTSSLRRKNILLTVILVLITILLAYWAWGAGTSLRYGIVLAGAWPADEIEACAGEAGCVGSVILRGGVAVWSGFLWLLAIIATIIISFRLRPSLSSLREKVAREGELKFAQNQRIGHVVGWVLVVSTFTFVAVLIFVPLFAGLVPYATWSKERRNECAADPMCVVSAIPENALPVWIAFIWIAIIAVALVVCWRPERWWMPDAEGRKHTKVRVFTTPFWIRIHALVAAFLALKCSFGVHNKGNDVYAVEYLWAVLAALSVAAAATVCKRKYGSVTPDDIKTSLTLTAVGRAGIFDRNWWKVQRELHPRGRDMPKDEND